MNLLTIAAIGYGLLGMTFAAALTYRGRWEKAVREQQAEPHTADSIRRLAEWTVDTKITVCSVTGVWTSMTLAEMANSPVPYRAWNVPTSVEFHPRSVDVKADEEKAKEHRG